MMIISKPTLLLLDIIFDNPAMRRFWFALYSFLGGMYLAVSLQYPFTPATVAVLSSFVFGIASILLLEGLSKRTKKIIIPEIAILENYIPNRNYEIVYILRRSDGVLKFGRTNNLSHRIGTHRGNYRMQFHAIASWIVPNSITYERIALKMTRKFAYTEGSRKELRQMTDEELSEFILTFTKKLQKGFRGIEQ